jgi:hypothetical protein
MPWNIVIPFAVPFPLVTAQGNLLIDIVGNNPGGGTPTFFLDAVQPGGATTVFGDIGPGAPGNLHFVSVMTGNSLVPRFISPGHTLSFTTLQLQNPPGLFGLGTGAPAVPIDLGPLGAPMNFLLIDPLVLTPHNWIQSPFFGFSATLALAVPNNPVIVGATVYGQSALLAPTANPLGLVVSRAVEVRIGDEFEVLPLQQLDAVDPIATTGALADFGAAQPEYGAVAIRFEGVFF